MPDHPLLQLGLPPDPVAWTALAAGLACVTGTLHLRRRERSFVDGRPRLLLAGVAALAALLSAGYVLFYLRGGPRIIDATAYFLQARALASGLLHFDLLAPTAAFRGRFLVTPPSEAGAESLGVLFPPGYPAVLALGFLVDRPLWVGPALAALLVLATYGLALRLGADRRAALLAATLSAVSAALRYHTADTMSHGLAALLLTAGLWAALGANRMTSTRRERRTLGLLLSGSCAGWLFATRPVTGLVAAAVCGWLVVRQDSDAVRGRSGGVGRLLLFGAACAPGLALLGWQQAELTGDWLASVQLRYYALADGPPGCFGLGVGKGFGCRHEHGDVVARFGPEGFGLGWALRNTLHRLHHHSLDLANCEPLWLLVPWALWRKRRHRSARALLVLGVGIFAAYGAFYFHGNYPGGGGRFFAELLPAEHALIAWTFAGTAWGRWLLPTALVGFACHGSFSHQNLAERDGGRPLFEPAVVARTLGPSPPGTLLFVDTDHGLLLGLDPALLHGLAATCPPALGNSATRSCVPPGRTLVARWNGDATDPLLWERLGRPPAFRYRSPLGQAAMRTAELEPLQWSSLPARTAGSAPRGEPACCDTLRFEAEGQWPALQVAHAWVEPAFSGAACVSAGRTLLLHGAPGAPSKPAVLRGELNVQMPGAHRVTLGLVPADLPIGLRFTLGRQSRDVELPPRSGPCAALDLGVLDVPEASVVWTLETLGPASRELLLSVDYFELTPISDFDPLSGHVAPNPGAESPR